MSLLTELETRIASLWSRIEPHLAEDAKVDAKAAFDEGAGQLTALAGQVAGVEPAAPAESAPEPVAAPELAEVPTPASGMAG